MENYTPSPLPPRHPPLLTILAASTHRSTSPAPPSLLLSTLITLLNTHNHRTSPFYHNPSHPTPSPCSYTPYTDTFRPLFTPALFGIQICVLGAADWTVADKIACLGQFNLRLVLPEAQCTAGVVRRAMLGGGPLVDMRAVRCVVFEREVGDLDVRGQLEWVVRLAGFRYVRWMKKEKDGSEGDVEEDEGEGEREAEVEVEGRGEKDGREG